MAEQLICNQQVVGSTPITSSKFNYMGEFPSGQRGQTVNLLSLTSLVRIQLPPPKILVRKYGDFYFFTFNSSLFIATVCRKPSTYGKVLIFSEACDIIKMTKE